MKEVWKPVHGFEGMYEISNDGRCRSIDRVIATKTGPRKFCGKDLAPDVKKGVGYKYIIVCVNMKKTMRYIHRMVAESFLENEESLEQVNHKDGNKLNNGVDNLEWCTPQQNTRHAFRSGLVKCKLNISKAEVIRSMYKNGVSAVLLGRIFDVSPQVIYYAALKGWGNWHGTKSRNI